MILDQHPSIVRILLNNTIKLLQTQNNRIKFLTSQSLLDRTFEVLKILQQYFPNKKIALSHEDIASLVDATRPRVTEALNALARENKIHLGHKSIRLI